ncbi:uncharacterized protein SEPMUDRAFT_121323 [Sphaerulina musiva SO2202]|uniref:DUF7918 domain-containing protein n=1 Tax=Sphaerulina musiva (strain SO2202) TaxID=692275 RepID=M3BR03_SPHMS|nr:uncharacterized protein SEPMUDRAFT_121323 [Sphaerulina musiva SO2202]EMF08548.1 hypothetical protein SEPMUDRAFT_121323 [Sphaerulina musiva SO2202]
MAISELLPGLTVSIQINGRELPEYRDEDIQDPERTTSYLIEAVADSIFEIHARANPQAIFAGSSLAIQFYVDGKYVDGTLIDAEDVSETGDSAKSQGRYVSNDMLRKYQFASREQQIEIVERQSNSLSSRGRLSGRSSATPSVSYTGYKTYTGPGNTGYTARYPLEPTSAVHSEKTSFGTMTGPSYSLAASSNAAVAGNSTGAVSAGSNPPITLNSTIPLPDTNLNASTTAGAQCNDLEELGTIKVVVCHVNKKQPVDFGRSSSATSKISDNIQKAIKDKAGGLLVRFTAPQHVAPVTTWDVDPANDTGDSSVTYIYHYRTREMLEALDVIPNDARILPLPLRAKKLETVEELHEHAGGPNFAGQDDVDMQGGEDQDTDSGSRGMLSAEGEDWDVVYKDEASGTSGR